MKYGGVSVDEWSDGYVEKCRPEGITPGTPASAPHG